MRGGLAIVSVDLDATAESGPWLGYVWINARRQDSDGLCLDDSREQRDLEALLSMYATVIGRVTTGGRREIYLHLPESQGFVETVSAMLGHLPADRWEAGISLDTSGDLLQRLLLPPTEAKEDLEARATVWAALPDAGMGFLVHQADVGGDVDEFVAERIGEGFVLIDIDEATVRFGRVEAFDRALAREIVLDLVRRVAMTGGTYLGFSLGEAPAVA